MQKFFIGLLAACPLPSVAFESKAFLGEDTTPSTAAADGIWTDKDWTNTTYNIGVKNGLPYGLTDEVSARIDQTQVLLGQIPTDAESNTNVALVTSLFTEKQWLFYFPVASQLYSYDAFLRAVAKFPAFCNEVGPATTDSLETVCKKEIATILAHITYETNSLQEKAQAGCTDAYNIKMECNYYTTNEIETIIWPPLYPNQYYGRGALMLQGNPSYGSFSNIAYYGDLYDKMTLITQPYNVAKDDFLAITSALWYYMTPQDPMPSMHRVQAGYYVPNDYDTSINVVAGFGATINIISEGLECSATASDDMAAAATSRASDYQGFCELLGLEDCVTNIDCSTMGPFTTDSASSYPFTWFKKNSDNENECELTDRVSGYSLYATRDYMRCVCDSWGQDVEDCLVGVADPSSGGNSAISGISQSVFLLSISAILSAF